MVEVFPSTSFNHFPGMVVSENSFNVWELSMVGLPNLWPNPLCISNDENALSHIASHSCGYCRKSY